MRGSPQPQPPPCHVVLIYVSGPPLAGTRMNAVRFFSRSWHLHFTVHDNAITYRFYPQDIQSESPPNYRQCWYSSRFQLSCYSGIRYRSSHTYEHTTSCRFCKRKRLVAPGPFFFSFYILRSYSDVLQYTVLYLGVASVFTIYSIKIVLSFLGPNATIMMKGQICALDSTI